MWCNNLRKLICEEFEGWPLDRLTFCCSAKFLHQWFKMELVSMCLSELATHLDLKRWKAPLCDHMSINSVRFAPSHTCNLRAKKQKSFAVIWLLKLTAYIHDLFIPPSCDVIKPWKFHSSSRNNNLSIDSTGCTKDVLLGSIKQLVEHNLGRCRLTTKLPEYWSKEQFNNYCRKKNHTANNYMPEKKPPLQTFIPAGTHSQLWHFLAIW
jgi:hypothetical protein